MLEVNTVTSRMNDVPPEPVREHAVRVGGVVYPVKQVFELASGVPRSQFTSQTALRHLRALGFPIATDPINPVASRVSRVPQPSPAAPAAAGKCWPWEGSVQAVFVELLVGYGWRIEATADTATKARGVDVLAAKETRRLGAEVKGWPPGGYADPRRAGEIKPTQPSTQAVHWFSQALFKAIMLLDSHPGHESLMVLPDYPRYRDLAARTRTGRDAAGVHVVLLNADGTLAGDGWTP